MPEQIDWLSTKEDARRLGIAPRTLYALIDRGELPAYHMGRCCGFCPHEVDTYVESCRVQPGELSHLVPERRDERCEPSFGLS